MGRAQHRHIERVLDRERDAAARSRVELRQGDAGQPCGVVEGTRLGKTVLPGCGVKDEQHLRLRVREPLADGAPDELISVQNLSHLYDLPTSVVEERHPHIHAIHTREY